MDNGARSRTSNAYVRTAAHGSGRSWTAAPRSSKPFAGRCEGVLDGFDSHPSPPILVGRTGKLTALADCVTHSSGLCLDTHSACSKRTLVEQGLRLRSTGGLQSGGNPGPSGKCLPRESACPPLVRPSEREGSRTRPSHCQSAGGETSARGAVAVSVP